MQHWNEEKARKIDKIDEQMNFGAGTVIICLHIVMHTSN
jgi:hypothetical protein